MTESEAKEILVDIEKDIFGGSIPEALDMAVQALEEIQSYRAIGTVEEFKDLKEKEEQRQEWERRTIVCPECGYKNLDKLPDVCPGCGTTNKANFSGSGTQTQYFDSEEESYDHLDESTYCDGR